MDINSPKRVRLQGNLYKPILPTGAISIVRPGRYGNPFKVIDGDVAQAILDFEVALLNGSLKITLEDVRKNLAGRDLACWCAEGSICHGDILLKYANS